MQKKLNCKKNTKYLENRTCKYETSKKKKTKKVKEKKTSMGIIL